MKAATEDRLLNELWLEAMKKRGSAELVLSGTSMQPIIPKGSRIRIDTALDAEAGHVACFLRNGRFFAHRVLLTAQYPGGRLYVEGPEMYRNPAIFTRGDLLGRVTAFRFPDNESEPWHIVEARDVGIKELISALLCLAGFTFLAGSRILLNKVHKRA